MTKKDIRNKINIALNELFSIDEAKKKSKKYLKRKKHKDKRKQNDDDIKHDNDNSRNQGEGGKKDYADVRRAFERLGGPSMVDIMKLMGIEDDEKGTNRSLFRKKVKQIKNKDSGSFYQFDDEELNKVRAALDIKK